jgi:uncharacterized repeat protein (TIGR03803 family)
MTHAKIVLSQIAHSWRLKSFRTSAALTLKTLMLLVAAATIATAQTYTDLHNLDYPNYPNDGQFPTAVVVQATDGNFYGVTYHGGIAKNGVIFKLTSAGAYSILYHFDGANGGSPESTPMQHTNGRFTG